MDYFSIPFFSSHQKIPKKKPQTCKTDTKSRCYPPQPSKLPSNLPSQLCYSSVELHTLMKAILRRADEQILTILLNSIDFRSNSIPSWRLYCTKKRVLSLSRLIDDIKAQEAETGRKNKNNIKNKKNKTDTKLNFFINNFFTLEVNFLHLLLIADTQSYAPNFVKLMHELFE